MDGRDHLSNSVSTASLAQLGQTIKDNADKINAYLAQNNTGNLSFALGASYGLDLPPALEGARQQLFDDMEHLTALLRGPLGHVITNSNPVTFSYAIVLAAISRFGIAERVPLDGSPIAINTLAEACHLKQTDLLPLLRAAIANRTFEGVGARKVKHNAVSAAIGSMPNLRDWLAYAREDLTPAAFALPNAIAKWPGASDPGHTAFALITPEHIPMFDAIRDDPARAARFSGSMRLLSRATAAEIPRVSTALKLEDLPLGATIVDIGGSTGEVLVQVLRQYEQLCGIVQDLPAVVAKAQVPDDLKERLQFQDADFFTEQPEKGATVYFLRKVLHDWSDEYAQRILRQLIPALKDGARVVLNELCVPPPGSTHPRREQTQRGWSLAMKWLLNGKERDEGEWKALFSSVDGRFTFAGIRPVPGASSSLIEFHWQDSMQTAAR